MSTPAVQAYKPLYLDQNSKWGAPTDAVNKLNDFMYKNGGGRSYSVRPNHQGMDTLTNLRAFIETQEFKGLSQDQKTEFKNLVANFGKAADGTFFAKAANNSRNNSLEREINSASSAASVDSAVTNSTSTSNNNVYLSGDSNNTAVTTSPLVPPNNTVDPTKINDQQTNPKYQQFLEGTGTFRIKEGDVKFGSWKVVMAEAFKEHPDYANKFNNAKNWKEFLAVMVEGSNDAVLPDEDRENLKQAVLDVERDIQAHISKNP